MNTTSMTTQTSRMSAAKKFYDANQEDFVSLHPVGSSFADGHEVYINEDIGCCFTLTALEKQFGSKIKPENIHIYKFTSHEHSIPGYKAFITIDNPTTFKDITINNAFHTIYMDVEMDLMDECASVTSSLSSPSTSCKSVYSTADSIASMKEESIKKMVDEEEYLDLDCQTRSSKRKNSRKMSKTKYLQNKEVNKKATNFTRTTLKTLAKKQEKKEIKQECSNARKTKMFSLLPEYEEYIKHKDTPCKACKNVINGDFHFYRKEKHLYCLFEQGYGPLCYDCLEDAIDLHDEYVYNERLHDETYNSMDYDYYIDW